MGYVLGQYNKNSSVADDDSYMSEITTGVVGRARTTEDSDGGGATFINECIKTITFSANSCYYFHGKIKRMEDSVQSFDIKLGKIKENGDIIKLDDMEQYIKNVTVTKGDENEWVDVEFIFTPFNDEFNVILFELNRIAQDYSSGQRWSKLIYVELSVINNFMSNIVPNQKFLKIGVQSRPGLLMCINGEEIRTSRSGIYEVRNGNITINFFSIVNAAACAAVESTMDAVNAEWAAAVDKSTVSSRCLFTSSKVRKIDSYTLDYMYREE